MADKYLSFPHPNMTNNEGLFLLPETATNSQIYTYNKNCQLLSLANRNIHRAGGGLMQLIGGVGIQDTWAIDPDRFMSCYPYSYHWYYLAYGEQFNITNNSHRK